MSNQLYERCETTEYIKREDVLKRAIPAPIAPVLKGDSVHYEPVIMAANVMDIPAADVRENKRGRWEIYEQKPDIKRLRVGYMCTKCSECGWKQNSIDYSYRFCPNCGSRNKMEESNVNDTETD